MLENKTDLLSNDLDVTPTIIDNLLSSAKWGKFLAIIGIITCVFLLLIAFFAAQEISTYRSYRYSGLDPFYIMIFYLVSGVMFFFPCLFLFRFCTKTMDAAKYGRQDSLEAAINSLKAMFRFMGIITILTILLMIAGMIIIILNPIRKA